MITEIRYFSSFYKLFLNDDDSDDDVSIIVVGIGRYIIFRALSIVFNIVMDYDLEFNVIYQIL